MIGLVTIFILGLFFFIFCALMLSPSSKTKKVNKSVADILYVSLDHPNQVSETPESLSGETDTFSESPHIMQADLDYVDINTFSVDFRVHFVRKTLRNDVADLSRLGKIGKIVMDVLPIIAKAPGFPVLPGDFLGGRGKYDIYLIQGSERFDSSFDFDDDTGDIILQSSNKSLYGYAQSVSSNNSIGASFVVINVFQATYNEPTSNSFVEVSDTEAADFALTLFHELTHAFHLSVGGKYAPHAVQEGLATASELFFSSWVKNYMNFPAGVLYQMEKGTSGKGKTFEIFGTEAVEHLVSRARPQTALDAQQFAENVSYEFFISLIGIMCFINTVEVTRSSSSSVFLQVLSSLIKNNSDLLPSAGFSSRKTSQVVPKKTVISGKISYSTLQAMRMMKEKLGPVERQADETAEKKKELDRNFRTAEQKDSLDYLFESFWDNREFPQKLYAPPPFVKTFSQNPASITEVYHQIMCLFTDWSKGCMAHVDKSLPNSIDLDFWNPAWGEVIDEKMVSFRGTNTGQSTYYEIDVSGGKGWLTYIFDESGNVSQDFPPNSTITVLSKTPWPETGPAISPRVTFSASVLENKDVVIISRSNSEIEPYSPWPLTV